MGGVVSFVKKVASGIKRVAKAVWNGVKKVVTTVAKAVVKAVEVVTKIVVNGIVKVVKVVAALVEAAVITAALAVCSLGLLAVGILSLPIIFISSLIKFGRSQENVRTNDNEEINDNVIISANIDENKPNFEEQPKKKKLNMKGDFEEDLKSFFDAAKNGVAKQNDQTYSFTKDDKTNECLSTRRNTSDIYEEAATLRNIVVSRIDFDYKDLEHLKYVELCIDNTDNSEMIDDEVCRKVMEDIKEICNQNGKVRIIEIEDDAKEIDLKDIKNIETIKMTIEF